MRLKLFSLASALFSLTLISCGPTGTQSTFAIVNGESINLEVGRTVQLAIDPSFSSFIRPIWQKDDTPYISLLSTGLVVGLTRGTSIVTARAGSYFDTIEIIVVESGALPELQSISIAASSYEIEVGNTVLLSATTVPSSFASQVEFCFGDSDGAASIDGNELRAHGVGTVEVYGQIDDIVSDSIYISIVDSEGGDNPYADIDPVDFYANYTEANSALDAQQRSEFGLMSGALDEQDQTPTLAPNQPKAGPSFLRNSTYRLNDETYEIIDVDGEVVDTVYRGGGYVTLEEVAAYIFAFNEIPANYIGSKSADPSESPWGKYLRLNHSYFSGDNTRFPYEPALPRVSGIGDGDFDYYELDIGTTGTDCDPQYEALPYNDGTRIERGAARIVYSRYYRNTSQAIDYDEKFLFYTYNHYNDFQEYLNYQGGWGEIFGNITGGGQISSTSDYNPTPYVPVELMPF